MTDPFLPRSTIELIAFNRGVDAVLAHIDAVLNALPAAKISHLHRLAVQEALDALSVECEGVKLTTEPEAVA